MGFIEFITGNLSHVLPILIVGVFGLAIILERIKALYASYAMRDVETFFDKVTQAVTRGKLQEALSHCEKAPKSMIARVVKAALTRAHMPETVIEDGITMAINQATHAIHKRISFLATIANVATLLGLFGTIVGLIHSFEAVGHADAQQKSALLSAGIATAMNSTMLGLGVAIPCMIAFSILVNRANSMISELENSSVRILDILKQRYYSTDGAESEGQRKAV